MKVVACFVQCNVLIIVLLSIFNVHLWAGNSPYLHNQPVVYLPMGGTSSQPNTFNTPFGQGYVEVNPLSTTNRRPRGTTKISYHDVLRAAGYDPANVIDVVLNSRGLLVPIFKEDVRYQELNFCNDLTSILTEDEKGGLKKTIQKSLAPLDKVEWRGNQLIINLSSYSAENETYAFQGRQNICNELQNIFNTTSREPKFAKRIEQLKQIQAAQAIYALPFNRPETLRQLTLDFTDDTAAAANEELAHIYRSRNKTLHVTLEKPGTVLKFSDDFDGYIQKNNPYAGIFKNCQGSPLEKQLHDELCYSIRIISQLSQENPDILHVQTIAPVVYHFTALAKEQPSPKVAFDLSDFCYHLTKVAQGFGKAGKIFFKGVGKGAINATTNNIAYYQSLVTHPIDDIVKPLCQAGIALGKAVFYATELAINDPEQFGNNAKCVALDLSNYVYDNPEEAIATVIELIISFKAPNCIKFKNVQSIVNGVQAQEKLAQTVQWTSNAATKIITPIKEVLAEAATIVSVGLEHGEVALKNLIKVAQAQPVITSVGDIAALKVSPNFFKNVGSLAKEVARKSGLACKTFEAIVHKIRNVGDDILDIMEKAGGHTLREHVSKTHSELMLRAIQDEAEAITTFTNKRTAINAVKQNLRNNAKEIAEWLISNPPLDKKKSFEYLHSYDIGKGIIKGKKNAPCDLAKSKIVLIPSQADELGFKILTAFPIPKG